jgi:hypothetical protein
MDLRTKIAEMDLAPDERQKVIAFLDEQDRIASTSEAKWAQYARIKHEFGTETADIALSMVGIRKPDKTSPEAWDVAAKHAHAYLVATSASQ